MEDGSRASGDANISRLENLEEFGDGARDGVVNASVQRAKVIGADGRVLFHCQVGDGLTRVAIIVYGSGGLLKRGKGWAIRWRELDIAPDGIEKRFFATKRSATSRGSAHQRR